MEPIKKQILFIENYPDIRSILLYLLEGAGYAVRVTGTLQEATQLAQQSAYDLYLLNHVFPDGSGLTLCRRLRALHPHTPIVFFSTAAHPDEVAAGYEAGATAYLVQPQDILHVEETVGQLLAQAKSEK